MIYPYLSICPSPLKKLSNPPAFFEAINLKLCTIVADILKMDSLDTFTDVNIWDILKTSLF